MYPKALTYPNHFYLCLLLCLGFSEWQLVLTIDLIDQQDKRAGTEVGIERVLLLSAWYAAV